MTLVTAEHRQEHLTQPNCSQVGKTEQQKTERTRDRGTKGVRHANSVKDVPVTVSYVSFGT